MTDRERTTDPHGHVPVLPQEVEDVLALQPGHLVVDLTLGAGGHAERILEATGPDGRLIGFDQDPDAREIAAGRLARFGDRLEIVAANFTEFDARCERLGIATVDRILLDAGVSSMQLDRPERGFSLKEDGPLDMRMSGRGVTAAELIATAEADELEHIFRTWGEEPRARAIARKIVEVRRRTKIKRTKELAELVRAVGTPGRGRTHPATRVFQALRIAVNGEIEALEGVLPVALKRLAPGGRMGVISFHSLEDRIVKNVFRDAAREGLGRVLGKKPVVPSAVEIDGNPRSRSARLRGFEKSAE